LINNKNIYVIGAGYVGFSTGVALANEHNVVLIDRDQEKVDKINAGICPSSELAIATSFKKNRLKIKAFSDLSVVEDYTIVFVAVPTDYDLDTNRFNTNILHDVLRELVIKKQNCKIVIKSTIPIGFTKEVRSSLSSKNIYFSPEFLREGRAYKDITKPDRIIVSPKSTDAQIILNLLSSIASIERDHCFCTDSSTAEAIKLFSNTYLAMRVAYFNELDTFSKVKGLNSEDLIRGTCMDQRIGMFYNNPSFGFGGYCFPKDTKQTQSETHDLPMLMPDSIVRSNNLRVEFLAEDIRENFPNKKIGMYRLAMKSGSDNTRSSSSTMLLMKLIEKGLRVFLYEPMVSSDDFNYYNQIILVEDFNIFTSKVDLIITNRPDEKISNLGLDIYSRNIFDEN